MVSTVASDRPQPVVSTVAGDPQPQPAVSTVASDQPQPVVGTVAVFLSVHGEESDLFLPWRFGLEVENSSA